ncbi:hypothetical protein PROFUN_03578 [Planoprotostelium fungivorum]|uniref:Uncharacterized protein n=1 Tax=Planoprotostelium fungivorum TaxID=1890364 RepID=A0A2P6MSI4_9EUKA|nr:hypothetical protein PROFUN_03578 [Planoprotostelium fungivorum]
MSRPIHGLEKEKWSNQWLSLILRLVVTLCIVTAPSIGRAWDKIDTPSLSSFRWLLGGLAHLISNKHLLSRYFILLWGHPTIILILRLVVTLCIVTAPSIGRLGQVWSIVELIPLGQKLLGGLAHSISNKHLLSRYFILLWGHPTIMWEEPNKCLVRGAQQVSLYQIQRGCCVCLVNGLFRKKLEVNDVRSVAIKFNEVGPPSAAMRPSVGFVEPVKLSGMAHMDKEGPNTGTQRPNKGMWRTAQLLERPVWKPKTRSKTLFDYVLLFSASVHLPLIVLNQINHLAHPVFICSSCPSSGWPQQIHHLPPDAMQKEFNCQSSTVDNGVARLMSATHNGR